MAKDGTARGGVYEDPSYPDKVADRIAGAIVDLAYTAEENPKIAAEVLLGHGKCLEQSERGIHTLKNILGTSPQRDDLLMRFYCRD